MRSLARPRELIKGSGMARAPRCWQGWQGTIFFSALSNSNFLMHVMLVVDHSSGSIQTSKPRCSMLQVPNIGGFSRD